jgi:hypothetical protein
MPKVDQALVSPSSNTGKHELKDELNKGPKKTAKRKFDSLESFVRTLASKRHPSLRLNPDAARLIARMAQQSVLELAQGATDLMRWKNKNTATLQSKDVKTFIERSYPGELTEAMLAHCKKAERKFLKSKKHSPTETES